MEVLVALGILGILMGGIFGFFLSQRDAYLAEELRLERDQNLRTAAELIFREVSTAGRGASDEAFIEDLSVWAPSDYIPSCPLAVVLDANPKITLGDGDLPDVITFAAVIPTSTNPTTLSAVSNGTELVVSLSNSNSEKQFKAGDIISVGYLPEYVGVVSVDGDTLGVDADLETSGLQPLSETYLTGSPLAEVSIVSYAVFNDENDPEYERHDAGRPLLKRKINKGGFYPVAENISGMKVAAPEEGVLQVALTGQTSGNTGMGSGVAKMVFSVSLRNAVSPGFATDCIKPAVPAGLVVEDGLDESYPCRVEISWDPVTTDLLGNNLESAGCPLTGYRVFYDTVAGACGNYVDVSKEDASGYELDVSAVPASQYYICVAAENSGGIGEKSAEVSIADITSPEAAGGLTATAVGTDQIALSWDEGLECDLAGYFLYRKKDGGAFTLATGLISSGSGYLDSGLEAGASYSYRVEAVDYGFNAGGPSDTVTVALP